MPITSSVSFERLHGTDREGGTPDRVSATMRFKVASSNRIQFLRDVLGSASAVGSPPSIFRTFPQFHPDYPYLPAAGYTLDQVGRGNSSTGYYDYSIITIELALPPFEPTPGGDLGGGPSGTSQTLWEYRAQGSAEFQTIPNTAYTFLSDGAAVNAPIGKRMPTQGITLVSHLLPYCPEETILGLCGKVNDAVCVNPVTGASYAAGTLLLESFTAERTGMSDGLTAWTIGYQFTYRRTPWNYVMRSDDGTYDEVDPPIYESGDFSVLP